MTKDVKSVQEYVDQVQEKHKLAFDKLRQVILDNLPEGYQEELNYGMLGYVVPHKIYPEGYHCDPKLPLPFINLADQKNFIGFYHNGIYAIKDLHDWFVEEYPKHSKHKLDMGKSCIRLKYMDDIPYELIGELVNKLTPSEWIAFYEKNTKNRK